MNPINRLIMSYEDKLDDFVQWQIDGEVTNDYSGFAERHCSHADLPKYASLLYEEFILIENVILMKRQFSEDNWLNWRRNHSAIASANVINHIHLGGRLGLLGAQNPHQKLTGELIAFFWDMCVKHQFPDRTAAVKFNGDIIYLEQKVP